ncbi:DNA gyrase subunit B [Clostridia bacterium]|nr:DNA gyrase subunit B [Clostridia bacterium]
MEKNYGAKDIKVLEGLDAVRMRPGMYIGTTGLRGLHHILWEIVDNSIDELTNGFGKRVEVTLYDDGSVSVEDDGRGVPTDLHPTLQVSGVEVVFTQLHAGGKFDNESYSFSGGLHGVGASVTNALSEWVHVEVYRDGKKHEIDFKCEEREGKIKSGIPAAPLAETGETKKRGTFVRFKPDARVFESVAFNAETIAKRLRELAFLNNGIHIVLTDERGGGGPQSKEYLYEGGLKDFCKYLNETKTPTYQEPIFLQATKDGIFMQIAMQHTDSYTESVFSYVNNIPTGEGGTHETGFKTALTKVFNDAAKRLGLLKEKDLALLGEDFREGLTAVLAIKMNNVQFEGQTKTKLGNPEARVAVESMVAAELAKFCDAKANQTTVEALLQKGIAAAKVREAARKAKEITRAKNSIDNANLVGKLSSCTGRKPENNELFIVEGDSAGGTAKQGRDRYFQAILPLRGKPLNAEKKRIDQVLQNEEIRTIISALGSGIGEDFNVENLNYHKVVILSDADQDGAHIRAILLTFFFRYMKDLIVNGHVYIGMPPLYKLYNKTVTEYVYSDAELDKAKSRLKGYSLQRYKGLGEMNAEQLWETTMSPQSRTLVRVTIDDAAEAEKLVAVLMGDAIDLRRQYIIEHADFNKEDTLIARG